jgi:hypothetical protein
LQHREAQTERNSAVILSFSYIGIYLVDDSFISVTYFSNKRRNAMKKLVIAAVLVLVSLSISVTAMAEGGKNQGTVGTGTTTTTQDPEPFDWPGIDWN